MKLQILIKLAVVRKPGRSGSIYTIDKNLILK
jgi:hypothetical protein